MIRTLLLVLIAACVCLPDLSAAENDSVKDFKKAMSGNNSTAKKRALAALQGEDDVVLPLLIDAVGDRQISRSAISALRSRTGLSPSPQKGGDSGYPGYPNADTPGAWKAWLSAKKKADAIKKRLEEEKKAKAKAEEEKKKAEEAKKQAEDESKEEDDKPKERVEKHVELGKLDRIFFKDGSILSCYILVKRTDLDGNLTSVRIMHKGGAGEEVLAAKLISRIDEDYK